MHHPGLYFGESDIVELRGKIKSGTSAWLYRQLVDRCNRYAQELDLTRPEWDRVRGIVHAHSVCRPLVELALAWVLSGEKRWLEQATAIFRRITSWQTWFADYEPTRGLMVYTAARAYDWLQPVLDEQLCRTAAMKILDESRELRMRALEEFPPHRVDSGPPRTFAPLGVAGLLFLDEADDAAEWVAASRAAALTWIDSALDDDGAPYYSSDGCYSTIAMSDLLGFVYALHRSGDTGVSDHPKLRKAALYPLYRMEPQRDGHPQFCVYNRSPLMVSHLVGLAGLYNDGLAQWHYLNTQGPHGLSHRGRTWGGREGREDLPMAIIWYRDVPVESPDESTRIELGKCFMPSGKLVMRSGYESTEAVYLTAECGPPRQGWSHADCGSFILDAYGERFVEDPGATMGVDYSASAQAHNLVLLDGVGPANQGGGRIRSFVHTSFADYAFLDQTNAYALARPVERAHRHIVFLRPGVFIVVDDIRAQDSVNATELLLHVDGDHQEVSQPSYDRLIIPGNHADLQLVFAQPFGASDVLGIPQPQGVMYGEHRMHRMVLDELDSEETVWFSISPAARRQRDRERVLFVTLFYPLRHGDTPMEIEVVNEGGATGYRIGESTSFLFNIDGGVLRLGEYQSDGALLLVDRQGSGVRCLAASCSQLDGPGAPRRPGRSPYTAFFDTESGAQEIKVQEHDP